MADEYKFEFPAKWPKLALVEFSHCQNSNAKNTIDISSTEKLSTSSIFTNATLMEEKKLVVLVKEEFEDEQNQK